MKSNKSVLSILFAGVLAFSSMVASADILGIKTEANYWSIAAGPASASMDGATGGVLTTLSFGGYLNKNLSFALDGTSISAETASSATHTATVSRSAMGVSATYRLPVAERLNLFGRGGLAFAKTEYKATPKPGTVGLNTATESGSKVVPVLSAGAEFELSERHVLGASFEYLPSPIDNGVFSAQTAIKLSYARRF